MSVNQSRFVAFWASHERRAQVYGRLLTVCLALLGLSLANTYRAWSQPREVVRIGCDGIPPLVRINEEVYQEPDEREIRAFASMFAVMYARGDSFSVVNDYVFAASKMTAELREPFRLQARGTAERPGAIQVVARDVWRDRRGVVEDVLSIGSDVAASTRDTTDGPTPDRPAAT